jgi:hypothetical protein
MSHLTKFLIAMALAIGGQQVHATMLEITPDDCVLNTNCITGTVTNTNPATDKLISLIGTMYGAEELYSSDIDLGVSSSFASSYNTTYSNGNSSASIEYAAGSNSIACQKCWLLVKDGIDSPPWYAFDISGWDGLTNISLNDFWPTHESGISHVSIFGGGKLALLTTSSIVPTRTSVVPEPGPLALLSIGFLGVVLFRRKRGQTTISTHPLPACPPCPV